MRFVFIVCLVVLSATLAVSAQERPLGWKSKNTEKLLPTDTIPLFRNIPPSLLFEGLKNDYTKNKKYTIPPQRYDLGKFMNSTYTRFIIPSALLSYGAIAKVNSSLKSVDMEIKEEVTENFTRTYRFDDYLRYVPSVAVYGLHLAGIKSKNNYRDQTFIMLSSHLLADLVVSKSKKLTKIERPDGDTNSFPSGHTTTAFVGAHIMFREYYDTSPWIGIAGYMAATTTGIMRVINNRHWTSDVIAGAGCGILCVEISYLLLPVFHKAFGIKKDKTLVLSPQIGNNSYGLGLAYSF